MNRTTSDPPTDPRIAAKTKELSREYEKSLNRSTDRLISWLMSFQFMLIAIQFGCSIWLGEPTSISVVSLILGAVLSAGSIAFALFLPATIVTQIAVCSAQVAYCQLYASIWHRPVEAEFHFLASMIVISFYRNIRLVLGFAGLSLLIKAVSFGSVAGTVDWLAELGGLLRACCGIALLLFLIRRAQLETMMGCQRHAELEMVNSEIELQVVDRTQELANAQRLLETELLEHMMIQAEREELYTKLAATSRQAGMAEIATTVLHNVGNILNSVNVSATLISDRLRKFQIDKLMQVCEMMLANRNSLSEFLEKDRRGQHIPEYLKLASVRFEEQRNELSSELVALANHVDHIKRIVATQQLLARTTNSLEPVDVRSIVMDAMKFQDHQQDQVGVLLDNKVPHGIELMTDRHKVMQILVNLIKNACESVRQVNNERKVCIEVIDTSPDNLTINVTDSGIGIATDQLDRIFTCGFTTKADGHGFGLHGAVLTARELKGDLTVQSEGVGKGATFSLSLPRHQIAM